MSYRLKDAILSSVSIVIIFTAGGCHMNSLVPKAVYGNEIKNPSKQKRQSTKIAQVDATFNVLQLRLPELHPIAGKVMRVALLGLDAKSVYTARRIAIMQSNGKVGTFISVINATSTGRNDQINNSGMGGVMIYDSRATSIAKISTMCPHIWVIGHDGKIVYSTDLHEGVNAALAKVSSFPD